jgi:hypothetical protein
MVTVTGAGFLTGSFRYSCGLIRYDNFGAINVLVRSLLVESDSMSIIKCFVPSWSNYGGYVFFQLFDGDYAVTYRTSGGPSWLVVRSLDLEAIADITSDNTGDSTKEGAAVKPDVHVVR